MNEELKAYLTLLADRKCWTDDEEDMNPKEMSGHNYDDCYSAGEEDGATSLARGLLAKFFKDGE